MRRRICVYNKDGELLNEFEISFFQRDRNELQLDLESFYKKYSGVIPEKNVEMRLDESAPFTIPTLLEFKTHIHLGKDMEWYICYPPKIDSMQDAIDIAKSWAILTVFQMKYNVDPNILESFGRWILDKASPCKNNLSPFTEIPLWIENEWPKWKVEIN
ncbi:MAG: hypothetical protein WAZ12_02505 [Candidatus Absconditicoccaceae bacterium]